MRCFNRFQTMQRGRVKAFLLMLPALLAAAWLLRVAIAALPIDQGPGGPILVLTSGTSSYGKYYAEILRTEGLNHFAVADVSTITSASNLATYDVVVLAKTSLTAGQVSALTTWVNGGGNLVAMAPDSQVADLFAIPPAGAPISDAYLLVDSSTQAGTGIVNQTIQFHGAA